MKLGATCKDVIILYEGKNTSEKIYNVIVEFLYKSKIFKEFYDIEKFIRG